MRWSESDVTAAQSRIKRGTVSAPKKRTKYGNQSIKFQGQTFDSKHELERWKDFEQQRLFGAIRGVIHHVTFKLPMAGRKIELDFAVIENDGRIVFYDAKGRDNYISQLKRDLVLDAYGIEIKLL